MPLSRDAQAVYNYLIRHVVPTRRVVTYADVHANTEVAYGEAGGYIGRVLGEIFEGCDAIAHHHSHPSWRDRQKRHMACLAPITSGRWP